MWPDRTWRGHKDLHSALNGFLGVKGSDVKLFPAKLTTWEYVFTKGKLIKSLYLVVIELVTPAMAVEHLPVFTVMYYYNILMWKSPDNWHERNGNFRIRLVAAMADSRDFKISKVPSIFLACTQISLSGAKINNSVTWIIPKVWGSAISKSLLPFHLLLLCVSMHLWGSFHISPWASLARPVFPFCESMRPEATYQAREWGCLEVQIYL